MKYQEWLNGCGCCPDIQDCPPSTGNPCDCDSILLELSKQHTDDLVLQDEIDNLDEKKLDASAYTPDEYATEEWVNEQGFLKTVEPLKTINGESLIGEGNIVISGGSGDAYTKAETDALLDEKQNVLNAGDYITIDSANTISTSGLVTVEDNEVPQFIAQGDMLTRYYPASGTPETVFANMPVKMKVRTSGWEPQSIDDIIYINDENGFVASGNCASRNQGVLTPSIPSELQPYLTVRFISGFYEGLNNLFEAKEGYRISYVDATMTDGRGQFEPGITPYFVAYEGGQSADAISENVYPALEKLTANKFDKDFTCNDPLLYEAAYKKFRIKTSNQNYDTISASTSATTNLARAYDVKTYVESKIGSGITSGEVQTMIDESISGKADTSDVYNKTEVYTKTEVDNKVSVKPNVWCGNESEWSAISGSTESGTIYLVY